MKSRYIAIFLPICVIKIFAQDIVDILPKKNRELAVKQITETTFLKHKNVSLYDKQGFLLQETSYPTNGDFLKRTYEYIHTNTLLIVNIQEYQDTNNEKTIKRFTYKHFYNPEKQCCQIKYYSSDTTSPVVQYDNFIYKDNLLQSYERKRFPFASKDIPDKVIYVYNNMKQVIKGYT